MMIHSHDTYHIDLKGSFVNISVSLPVAVILLMMIWALRGDVKLILGVANEASQLGTVQGRSMNTFLFLWVLVLVSWPIFRNTFNYKSRCLKKCIPLRNVWIMTYEGGPTLCMVLSPRQSCSNQTVGKKIPLNQLFPLITVFFPSWPWIFNHKFSRRWLKTDSDERSCSKQPLSHPWGESWWRIAMITSGKRCSLASILKVYF
jgi:hypothetical protein